MSQIESPGSPAAACRRGSFPGAELAVCWPQEPKYRLPTRKSGAFRALCAFMNLNHRQAAQQLFQPGRLQPFQL